MSDFPPMPIGHYVYLHVRLDTNAVFYVGKGYKRRAWACDKKRNPHHIRTIRKMEESGHGWEVRILREGMTSAEAFALEIETIAFYGRDNLTNLTDGGDGSKGHKRSAEAIEKTASANRGKKRTAWAIEQCAAAKRGVPRSPETRAKLSAAIKGVKHSPERNAIKSRSMKGIRRTQTHKDAISIGNGQKIVCVETGIVYHSQSEAARQMGLLRECIRDVLNGRQRSTGGFSFKKLSNEEERNNSQ